jgi:hypothetical protein
MAWGGSQRVMETEHWNRLPKNQPAEIMMVQISEVQEAPAFNGRRSFLPLRPRLRPFSKRSDALHADAGLARSTLAESTRQFLTNGPDLIWLPGLIPRRRKHVLGIGRPCPPESQ